MNDLAKQNSTGVGSAAANPFLAYGEQASQKSIVGQLLRFTKGDFLAGQEDDEVPVGTQFVANMDEMLAGWIRWEANKPTDHVMGKVSEGYQPPRRNELGDTDKAQWEADDRGDPRDPWQFSNYLLLKGTGDDTELYTFTTSSKGGLNALGDLCKSYGKAMAQRPDAYPVIAIGVNAYDHPNRSYGRIKVPTFQVVGWAPKAVFAEDASAAAPASQERAGEEPVKKPKARI
jgi:hypothetical protein